MRVEVEKTVLELQELDGLLNTLGEVTQAKLAYMVAKNKAAIKPFLEAFREALKPSQALIEYERGREQLLEKHARRDPKGNAIKVPLQGGAWQYVLESEAKYAEAFAAYKEEHAAAVTELGDLEERRKQLIEEREKVTLHTMCYADLKEDEAGNLPISAAHLSGLISDGLITEV